MSKNLDVRSPRPPSFDLKNAALGAGVSILLVGLLGYGPIILLTAITPPGEGANIGGGILASLGCLLAVALAAAVTSCRAQRRQSQPMAEGVSAGLAGFALAVAAGYAFFVARGIPLLEIFSVLPLLLPGLAAAYAGAALGGLRRHQHKSR
jgi:hypothetical protein